MNISVMMGDFQFIERSAKRGAKFFLKYRTKLSMSARPVTLLKAYISETMIRSPCGFHCREDPFYKN